MIAQMLWQSNETTALACLNHPFVQGLADGSLPPQRFARYMEQDAYFLDAFARAYAMALAKSPDRDGFFAFKNLLDGVLDELELHEQLAARHNLNLEPEPSPATTAYTDFLLRVAAMAPVGEIVAAMTPCMRLYAYLGQELSQRLSKTSPYRDWVMTYSSPEFEGLATRLEDLLDRYGKGLDKVASHYIRAMELEYAFFDEAWNTGGEQ
ncbi:MAG: TenA family protein [Candidatus Hydrogenedentes bacterium]|nr:TenA family protein [Candidatus Hydrogenedentota bacterium]